MLAHATTNAFSSFAGANRNMEDKGHAKFHKYIPQQFMHCRFAGAIGVHANGAGRSEHPTGDMGPGTRNV